MELEWEQDLDEYTKYEWLADFGPFTLFAHTVGQWWIEDAVGAKLMSGYAGYYNLEGAKEQATAELQHRLHMAAKTLDSNWLEVEEEETYENAINEIMAECTAFNGWEPSEEELAWAKSPTPAGTNDIGDVDESDDDFKDIQEAPEFFFENLSRAAGQQIKCTEAQWTALITGVAPAPESGYSQILASIKAESKDVKL